VGVGVEGGNTILLENDANGAEFTNTVPFTFGNGDSITIDGYFEVIT